MNRVEFALLQRKRRQTQGKVDLLLEDNVRMEKIDYPKLLNGIFGVFGSFKVNCGKKLKLSDTPIIPSPVKVQKNRYEVMCQSDRFVNFERIDSSFCRFMRKFKEAYETHERTQKI
jgi:hypothetical protein